MAKTTDMLPSNVASEKKLLGHILYNPRLIRQVMDRITPDDFYRDTHAIIYQTMLDLTRDQRKCNFINVENELQHKNLIDKIGGPGVLPECMRDVIGTGGEGDGVDDHAAEIKQCATYRRLTQVGLAIFQAASHREDDALEQAQKMIYEIAMGSITNRASTMAELVPRFIDLVEKRRENFMNQVANGIPTGFISLDRLLGGLQKADLIILAARPSVGKTALSTNIARNIVMNAKRVLFNSLEMKELALVQRLFAMEAPIDQSFLRDGSLEEEDMGLIYTAAGKLSKVDLLIDDKSRTIAEIRDRARYEHMMKPLDLIVVDYLQLVLLNRNGRRNNESRAEEVASISRSLKELAMELNVPILALAQLNRAIESRADKTPMLSDLKESGAIEQDADNVLFLHCTDEALELRKQCKPYQITIIVGKQRNGRVGEVDLQFRPRSTRFEDPEQQWEDTLAAQRQQDESETYGAAD
jgi:replicative DNA helicase